MTRLRIKSSTAFMRRFFTKVAKDQGLKGWRLQCGGPSPSECISDLKLIRMSDSYVSTSWYYAKEGLLHEVAHAMDPRKSNYGEKAHDAAFFRRLGVLLIVYAEVKAGK